MKLYAWQPNGHGELSYFVCAANVDDAKASVEAEQRRLYALPLGDVERITDFELGGWGTDYYTLTEVEPGVVVTNGND